MTATPTLESIALHTRNVMLEQFRQDSCIGSSLVGQRVLAAYGITSRTATVQVAAYNRAFTRATQDRVPLDQMPPTAWSVGIQGDNTLDRENNRWNGHLVLTLKWEGQRILLDLSADQMSRPDNDLLVPGPVAVGLPRLWTPVNPAVAHLSGGNVTIEYRPQLNAEGWREARAAKDASLHAPLVDDALHRINSAQP